MHSFLAFTLAFSVLSQHVAAQTSGTFNAMTFNVAGLPEIINGNEIPGDKTENTRRIGELFTRYNISLIHVQEDFNYHAALYAADEHPFRTPTSGGVPFGSGLNSLSNYEYSAFTRVKWATCSNFDSADCLTPKGFTFMRVKFAEGVVIDAYNLHADAGTTAADLKARAANLRQVSDYIKTNSIGNPVLVFGDSNTRYTRADDNPSIFRTENGMTDAWIQLARNGVEPAGGADALICENPSTTTACEIVDKMWYRGSSAVTLRATKFQYAGNMFLQDDGSILSDHNPVLVDFSWTLNAQRTVSHAFGGATQGSWFNDLDALAAVDDAKVSSITLRGKNRLDAVSLTFASGQTFSHGGNGGTATTLTLNAGERFTSATVCRGDRKNKTRVFYTELRTSASRNLSAGVKTNDCTEFSAPSGSSIVGFLGRSGDEIDQLGFVYATE